MSKKKRKKPSKQPAAAAAPPPETRAAEAVTVGWTVSLTALLLCELVAVAVHFYVKANPDAQMMQMLRQMLLFGACVVGALVLLLIPVMRRLRKLAPPPGLVAFGAFAAAAPLLAVLLRVID
ncbi:MAG: hypothetical protein AAGA92_12275 [Planctomycetota bacterium]